MTISKLTSADLHAVDSLMKSNSKTLGFLPREVLLYFLKKESVLGTKTDDGQLIGYLLYASYPNYIRITQLCVSETFRGQDWGKQLFEELRKSVTTQKDIRLHCRNDFPTNHMWSHLGFIPLGEKPGRSASGHPLTHWHFTLARDDQLSLFQAKVSDDAHDVAIDAQVFFDFDEPDSARIAPSQALFHDFSDDFLRLWTTDELFVEIHRGKDPDRRFQSRQEVHRRLRKIEHKRPLAEHFEEVLKGILPVAGSESRLSDIRHIAKVAASDVKTFVTCDRALGGKADDIADKTGVRVLQPTELIIRLHKFSKPESYRSTRISGSGLIFCRLDADNLSHLPYDSLLYEGERRGPFKEKLNAFLAEPDHYRCELLQSEGETVAIRILTSNSKKTLSIKLARVARSAAQMRELFDRFLITDTVSQAVEKKLSMVKIEKDAISTRMMTGLYEMGFTEYNGDFVRFCFSQCLDREEALDEISALHPESKEAYFKMQGPDLERCCSPLSLKTSDQPCFLMPIRPGYAESLVDPERSAGSLLGGVPSVLLSWYNIYYRKKNRHKMFGAPGRILWYVTAPEKCLVAISHLDAVEVGVPKDLFRKFKKHGILEWEELYEMCNKDVSNEIMALKFSHTFPFRKRISLDKLRCIFKKDLVGFSVQAPLRVPIETFQKVFQHGYLE